MLYREIIAFRSQIHTKYINTLCGQNVEFVNVKPGGRYSDHWAVHIVTSGRARDICIYIKNDMQGSSSYRAVNTLCLGYKNQSVNAV
jgi:hypothetical protein